MGVPWYERDEVKDRLLVFGRAIQGAYPYKVVIEPDQTKCRGGCCSFDTRTITVNPALFDVPSAEQYLLTKALLVHEAGHKRHTTPTALPPVIRELANILEDERIERRMCEEFVGVGWLIARLAERFYEEATPVDQRSDLSKEVARYVLQMRWALRIGEPVKGGLSSANLLLFDKVKPLVHEAWQAESSVIVNRNAARIADILDLRAPIHHST